VQARGQFHDGLVMAADIHNYYSSEDAVLNLLEVGDNLPSTNPALGHTNVHINSIF
jgi:hypothetical protein